MIKVRMAVIDMKRLFSVLIITILLCGAVMPFECHAAESTGGFEEIYNCIDDMMSDSGVDLSYGEISGLSLSDIIARVRVSIADRLSAPIRTLVMLCMTVIISSAVKNTGGELSGGINSDIFSMISIAASATVIVPELINVYNSAFEAVERTGSFILVFVPVFSGITAALGGIFSAGLYNGMVIAASEVLIKLVNTYFMPVISAVSALAAAGSVFMDASLERLTELLRKFIVYGLTVAVTLFTGFVSLKCTLSGKADGVASKTAKFMISGLVPIVGGAVTDAYATVRSSMDIIRCTAGTAGTFAIILILLPPIIEIVAYRAVIGIGAAAAEIFSADRIQKLLKTFDSGLSIAQSVLICYGLMFILCTGILMNCIA